MSGFEDHQDRLKKHLQGAPLQAGILGLIAGAVSVAMLGVSLLMIADGGIRWLWHSRCKRWA